MNITEATEFQSVFDRVMAGTANLVECHEVIACCRDLQGYLREAELRARALPERRDALREVLSPEARARLDEAIAIDAPGEPRIVFIKQTGEVMRFAAYKARMAEAEVAEQKARDDAAAAADAERIAAEEVAAQKARDDEAARAVALERARVAAENAAAAQRQMIEEAAQAAAELAAQVAAEAVTKVLADYGIEKAATPIAMVDAKA